jgi:DNA-binding NtrC family response regulator
MSTSASRRLSQQLVLASLGTVVAVGVVCAVGLVSLGNASGVARQAVTRELELAHIRRVLAICGGNRTMAAQHLGITRQTLTKRLGGGGSED